MRRILLAMISRWRGATAIATLGVLVVAVGFAQAAKLTTERATVALPPDDVIREATAKCPRGTAASGGGIEIGNPGEGDNVEAFYPGGKRRWTAAALRFSGSPGDSEVTALARCLKGGAIATKSKTVTLPNDTVLHSVTVKCPKGTKVAGGGVQAGEGSPKGSYPSGKREWTAVGFLSGMLPEPSQLTVFARCLKDGRLTRKSTTVAFPADLAAHTATAKCPRGTKATGGGIELVDFFSDIEGSYPAGKRRWRAVGDRSGVETSELTSHVVCLKKPKK